MGEHICPALIPLLLIKGHRFSFRESPFPTLSSYSLFKADDIQDISISSTPLEDIIKDIYRGKDNE